ncbi:MAG: hypothetical protein FWH31_08450 [Streptococcaceae bacterium]|nr:hypothetical protein [Streptococcaceae bacterium]
MKFLKLKAKYSGSEKIFDLSHNTTLIFSTDNSVGKSTLLRMLLYSLGYNIPSTQKVRFNKLYTEMELEIKGEEILIKRHDNQLEIFDKLLKLESFVLPEQQEDVLEYLFKNKNTDVIENILGAIYLDQDKGWTLLNRGIVIGSIRFNIESLIAGLAEIDITEEKKLLGIYEQQLKKYRGLRDINDYQTEFIKSDTILNMTEVEKINDQIAILSSRKRITQKKLNDLYNTISKNNSFISELEKLKLEIIAPKSGECVPVNKKTIVGYDDNANFLEARKWSFKEEIVKINSEIDKLQNKKLESQGQLDLFNSKDSVDKANQLLQTVKIDTAVVDAQIETLSSQIKAIKEQIQRKLNNRSNVVDKMSKLVIDYASRLNVEQFLVKTDNLLFVNRLKDLSGTVLHKLVLCFKLAYIKMIESYLDIKLPIVLDSPSGREITSDNIHEMFQIIETDFKENQKIIASIYDDIFKYDSKIQLNEKTKLFGWDKEFYL